MQRISTRTAATSRPPAKPEGTPGYFTNGNPVTGIPATVVDAVFLNGLQEALAHPIEATGQTLDYADDGQLTAAIRRLGLIAPFDLDFARKIRGYPRGAIVSDPNNADLYWRSTKDNNLTTPGTDGAAWVNFFADYLAKAGPAQSSSSPTTFTNGLFTNAFGASGNAADIRITSSLRMGERVIYCSEIAADGAIDVRINAGTRFGNNTAYLNSLAIDGAASRRITGDTNVSDQWGFALRPIIPVGNLAWYETNRQAISVGDVLASFLNNFGRAQTSTSPTTFSGGLYVPLGISSTATTNKAVMATGDAFLTFMRLGGEDQTCSSSTTFKSGLFVNALGAPSGSADIQIVAGLRMGKKTLYCNAIEPDGSSDLQIKTDLRLGIQTIYANKFSIDGDARRRMDGATDVIDQWDFDTRPTVAGKETALVSDVTPRLTIPGATNPEMYSFQATYSASDGENGTLIRLPKAFETELRGAFGNDVGPGVCSFGITIIDRGSVRIWARLGTVYQTGGITLNVIGY
ncbi:hypothetical protein [Asaia astilbis]|uniref:hypothetical protein n=1 Tax=Asaia astilbis TaxID=610244 RepID=UPI00046F6D3B|nr:hypothetical protein [Asaia astilbis]